jgi:hypothetical protein
MKKTKVLSGNAVAEQLFQTVMQVPVPVVATFCKSNSVSLTVLANTAVRTAVPVRIPVMQL